MYAVIKTGGKQYRVREGDTLRIEKLTAETGAKVQFDQVLMVGEGDDVKLGTPYVSGTQVSATVIAQGRADKIKVVKFKRRKNYLRQKGHRQDYTEVEINKIGGAGKAAAKPAAESAEKPSAAPKAAPEGEAAPKPKAKAPAKKAAKKTATTTTKKTATTTTKKTAKKKTKAKTTTKKKSSK